MEFVREIELNLNVTANKNYMPMQDGDVVETWADTNDLATEYYFNPEISIKNGVKRFIDWYRVYYS